MSHDPYPNPEPSFQQPPTERPAIRASDAERNTAMSVIDEAMREGRISPSEHADRVARAQSALTRSELETLTADLMPVQDAYQADELAPFSPAGPAVPTTYDSNQFSVVLGTKERKGVWVVPPRLTFTGFLGSVKLDLRDATFESPVVTIHMNSIMSDVKIWVPDGVTVIEQTSGALSDTKFKGLSPAQPGRPQIVLTGTQVMSDLIVYGSDHVSLTDRIRGKF